MPRFILKIQCKDQLGLVHKVSGLFYNRGLNMIENEEFVDIRSGQFFMRSELEGSIDGDIVMDELRMVLPLSASIDLFEQHKKDIVILVTKEHHCLGDLLVRHHFGELSAHIIAVVGNHDLLRPFVNKFDIPFHHVSAEGLQRDEHEAKILDVLSNYDPEVLVLAKYMRVLTSDFIVKYKERIVNIHHSFLPAFAGAKPYTQAFDRGVKLIGATAHFVNENLDDGPIIMQDVITTTHSMNATAMAKAGHDVEKIVLANALKLVFTDRVFIHGNKTVIL